MKTKKNTIKLTESELKKIISESVKRVLKEDTERVRNVEYDENTSFRKGRKCYYCHDNGRYYTNIDGEWYICTDNYYLEPDVHVDPSVKIVIESVKRNLKENAAFDVQDNLLESFDELKNALMEIRDVYSFDDYLENLSFAIQSACRVINELTALNNNR